jgi:hypothetical protein
MSSTTLSTASRHQMSGLAAAEHVGRRRRLARFVARPGFREFLLIAAVYGLYDLSRFVVEGRQATALAHAWRVIAVEKDLDINWEHWLNQVVSAHWLLAVPADYVYATLHYVVTPVVLVWMWRKHREHYGRARTTLIVATVIGLVGFSLMPVAPPRMLPGFVDTMARYSTVGWWSQDASAPRGLGGLTNQFAAMPSLHVGWALWCGWQLVRHSSRLTVKALGVLYPTLISIVVIATGNHYLLDAVAGAAVVVLAVVAVGGLSRLLPVRSTSQSGDGSEQHVIDLDAPTPIIDLDAARREVAPLASQCG